ncbi:hypothetical protein [Streptomyces sp. 6-11-2]|nr:hypothetical protein [Streptomyces sp. 6-11-2]GED89367.1 hypothetical protein TNCT6_64520 [Streptomyces sp. 6-11-2]
MSPVPAPAPAATADRPAAPASVRTPHASVTDGRPPTAVEKAAAEGRTV